MAATAGRAWKIWAWIVGVILAIVLTAVVFAGNYLATYALSVDENGQLGSQGGEVYTGSRDTPAQAVYDRWVTGVEVQDWTLQTADNLALAGFYYPAEQPSHNYVLAVHGYTVDHRSIVPSIVPFVDSGYNVLAVDQRGRGQSQGNVVSMGAKEKDDIKAWVDLILDHDPKAQIVLYGESMGGATVLLTAADGLPDAVVAVVEDCGYTSAQAMFRDQLQERFGLPEFPFLPVARLVGMLRFGVDFGAADPINKIANTDLPILFIHGGADDYVPTYMGPELYEAYAGPKELLIVDGAGHAESADVDRDLYYSTVFSFLDQYVK